MQFKYTAQRKCWYRDLILQYGFIAWRRYIYTAWLKIKGRQVDSCGTLKVQGRQGDLTNAVILFKSTNR